MATSNTLKFIGVLGLLAAGGFATAKAIASTTPAAPDPAGTGAGTGLPAVPNSPQRTFPLVMGMKSNPLVLQLQKALLSKGGPAALEIQNSGGADGSFGAGTSRALAASGLPQTSVSEQTFNLLVYGTVAPVSTVPAVPVPAPAPAAPTASSVTILSRLNQLQSDLKNAVDRKDAVAALKVLQALKTPADYHLLNDNGDGLRFWDSLLVNQTIVTKVLKTWPGDPRFEAAFSMIGLVKQNGTWSMPSLAGLGAYAASWTAPTPPMWAGSGTGHEGFPDQQPNGPRQPPVVLPPRRRGLGELDDTAGDVPPANW